MYAAAHYYRHPIKDRTMVGEPGACAGSPPLKGISGARTGQCLVELLFCPEGFESVFSNMTRDAFERENVMPRIVLLEIEIGDRADFCSFLEIVDQELAKIYGSNIRYQVDEAVWEDALEIIAEGAELCIDNALDEEDNSDAQSIDLGSQDTNDSGPDE